MRATARAAAVVPDTNGAALIVPDWRVMEKRDNPFQIAIYLYPGATALDAVGLWEVLSACPIRKCVLLAKRRDQ
jgi:hypothetical protein